MSQYGRSLVPGTVVVLAQDNSLVYVEDMQPTFAAVVALPEQLPHRNAESRALVPGRVGAKKISPFSQPDCTVDDWNELSERNREFLATFMMLREKHGSNFIDATPEEAAKMSVRKAGPAPRVKLDPTERAARKEERRALKKKCAVCGERKSKHDDAVAGHAFEAKAGRTKREPKAGARVGKSSKFRLKSTDLAQVQAANDKFKPGNRFHRVFLALQSLPESTGTYEEIIEAVERDGLRAMTDAAKVTRRALKQLASAGNVERV